MLLTRNTVLATAIVASLLSSAFAATQHDLDTVRQAIYNDILPTEPVPGLAAFVDNALDHLNASCWFDDVNYFDSEGRSWWMTSVHLQRSMLMAIAFSSPLAAHHGNQTVYTKSHCSLQAWIQRDITNSNWWWNDIGIPHIISKTLLLLNDSALTTQAAVELDRASLAAAASFTGCNRVWVAMINVVKSVIENSPNGNLTRLQSGYDIAYSAVFTSEQHDDGIQADHSFHQHGPQLYMGWGYGGIYTTNILVISNWAANTTLFMGTTSWEIFSDYVLEGQQLATRGSNFDFSASGRLMTYYAEKDAFGIDKGHYHYFAAFTPFAQAVPSFDPPFTTPLGVIFAPLLRKVDSTLPRADELRMFGSCLYTPDECVRPTLSRHYYDSDYVSHQHADYTMTLRMFSNRTLNSECVNSENLQGRDLADGTLTVYHDGNEYSGTYPVWDWKKIPGTTELQSPTVYDCASTQHVFHTVWVGAASNNQTTMATMDFDRGTELHIYTAKSWILVENLAIVLIANMSSTGDWPLSTSLNQCQLRTPVEIVKEDGSTLVLQAGQNTSLRNAQRVRHDNVTYHLSLDGQDSLVNVSTQNQTGSLANITQGNSNPITMPMFLGYYDHGSSATPRSLAYAIEPTGSEAAPLKGVTVLTNTLVVQAVCVSRARSGMYAVVRPASPFVAPTINGAEAGCWDLTVHDAGIFMVESQSGQLNITINTPLLESRPQTLSMTVHNVHLSCKLANVDYTVSIMDNSSLVSVTLPIGGYSGWISC